MSSHSRANPSADRWRLWPAMVLITVSLLGLMAMQGYEVLRRLPRAAVGQALVTHSFTVIVTAQALRSAVQDAERGQRGYLLTGRGDYLKPYRSAIVGTRYLLATLTRLTLGDAQDQRYVPELARRIDVKLGDLQGGIQAFRSGGLNAARRVLETNAGRHPMQSIEDGIDAVIARENSLLSRRLAKVAAQERTVEGIATASTVLASLLMVLGLILVVLSYRKGRRLQSELARRAEDVAEANQALERRNSELAQAMELARAAQEEARQAERAKGRFLATASHDLRQPLQAVSLLNGALRRTVPDPEISDVLRQQNEAIGAMGRLLNALLDISKLESGAIQPEPADFAVSALFDTMAREFRSVAASKDLELDVEATDAWTHSDPSLVEQILRNLVSNAIKYTREGRVRLRAVADPEAVRIEVSDTGVGIAQEQIRLLGEEFYQVGVPSNSTREGYGLGLSIVRRLVKLLGVELEIRSQVGRGSTFSLRLPPGASQTVPARPQGSTPKLSAGPINGGARILLIEDDAEVRNATRMLLKAEGYGVTAAGSSDEAVRKATEEDARIALVVTDFHLGPGETGVQVILRVREVLRTPVKAVLITGDTSSAIRDLPPDPDLRVLSKPVQAEVFLGLVRELLAA